MYSLIPKDKDFDMLFDSLLYALPIKEYKNKSLSNIKEKKDNYLITFDMPGISPENLKITVEDTTLHIEGCVEYASDDDRQSRRYNQTWNIPRGIDLDKITAELKFGVLTLNLPKGSSYRARDIPVLAT